MICYLLDYLGGFVDYYPCLPLDNAPPTAVPSPTKIMKREIYTSDCGLTFGIIAIKFETTAKNKSPPATAIPIPKSVSCLSPIIRSTSHYILSSVYLSVGISSYKHNEPSLYTKKNHEMSQQLYSTPKPVLSRPFLVKPITPGGKEE